MSNIIKKILGLNNGHERKVEVLKQDIVRERIELAGELRKLREFVESGRVEITIKNVDNITKGK